MRVCGSGDVRRRRLPCRSGKAVYWRAALPLGHATIFAAAQWRRAHRGARGGTSSCRYRCRSRRLRYWVSETWRAPCLWRPLPASLAGGAGARPDHPINGNGLRRTFANNLALWHPGNPHTIIEALAAGEVNRVVTRYGSPIAAHRETRIERKSRLRSGPRPPLRSEQRQGRGEMEMAEGIIVVVFEAPAQPSDRFSISTQLQFGEADPHHPIAGIGIAGRQAERLVNVGIGLGGATKV